MKQVLITIAAVLLVGCGGSESFTETINNPWLWIAIYPFLHSVLYEVLIFVLGGAIVLVGYFLVKFLSRKHGGKAKTPSISIREAAFDGNIEAIKQHLAIGTDVNAKGNIGDTPLDWAIRGKHTEIADYLRKHGGKSGAADSIYVASMMGNIEAVKQHLAAGTDVNAKRDHDGWTPLHSVARWDHKEVVELLIAKGADVNAKNKSSKTPLHLAICWDHKEVAELLIAKDADVNAKDADGKTPLDRAIMFGIDEIADLLRKHGGKTGEELKAVRK